MNGMSKTFYTILEFTGMPIKHLVKHLCRQNSLCSSHPDISASVNIQHRFRSGDEKTSRQGHRRWFKKPLEELPPVFSGTVVSWTSGTLFTDQGFNKTNKKDNPPTTETNCVSLKTRQFHSLGWFPATSYDIHDNLLHTFFPHVGH